jgi:hypothetical protein
LAGWIVISKIALQPILALAAIVLAIKRRMREALLAFAGMIAVAWLTYLPPIALHGVGWEGIPHVVYVILVQQVILAPLLAIAVAALAVRNQRLGLATALAVLPTTIGVLGVVVSAIGVAIHAF